MGRIGLSAALALGLAACNQAGGGAQTGDAKAGFPPCTSEQLSLKLVSHDAATATSTYRFENRSRGNCVLRGFAKVTLSGADGQALEAVQSEVASQTTRRRDPKVVLRPNRRANFSVVYPQAGEPCASFVKVTATPPGADWGLDAAQEGRLCGGKITVSSFWFDATGVM